MGEDSFKGITFGFVLFTLFAFFSLSFIDQMGDLNEIDTTDVLRGTLNSDIFNESLQNVSEDGEPLRERFENAELVDVDSVSGIKDIFETIVDFVMTPWLLMSQIMTNVLLIPTLFTHIILTLVILTFIFSLWRLFKQGS